MATSSSLLAWKIPRQRCLVGYSPRGHRGSDTTERLTKHTHTSLQYTHRHTQPHTPPHHTQTHTDTQTHMPPTTHRHTQTQTQTHRHTHTHTSLQYTHRHTHTHTPPTTHTHTHIHPRVLNPVTCGWAFGLFSHLGYCK